MHTHAFRSPPHGTCGTLWVGGGHSLLQNVVVGCSLEKIPPEWRSSVDELLFSMLSPDGTWCNIHLQKKLREILMGKGTEFVQTLVDYMAPVSQKGASRLRLFFCSIIITPWNLHNFPVSVCYRFALDSYKSLEAAFLNKSTCICRTFTEPYKPLAVCIF